MQHTAKNCVPGRPFTRGADPRRNTLGRPKNFDAFRELAQAIAHEKITDANCEEMTRVECILRDWSESKDVQKQIAFVQYGYGKPVDEIETTLRPRTVLRLYYGHERPITAVNGEGTRGRCLAKFANGA